MDPITIAALIGAGTSLAGGFLKGGSENVQAGRAADQAANNERIQMMMATQGLSWRANDAMNAYKQTGIHPLAMLGVSGPTYSPSSYVGSGGMGSAMGDAISSGGQNITRAIHATSSQRERLEHASRMDGLLMERGKLENDLLKMRIASEGARLRQELTPPAPFNRYIIDGQGNLALPDTTTNMIKQSFNVEGVDPKERQALPELGYLNTPRGGYIPVPGDKAKERIEDDFWAQTGFAVRNNLLPGFNANMSPPGAAPSGYRWVYDWVNGYRLERASTWHSRDRHPSERR